jgi:hypothetical protein
MSVADDNDELKKAKFYYEAVLKTDGHAQKSYERVNTKINIYITVLSTLIPILTGVGYVAFSSTLAVPFFTVYLISLGVFVWALAKCLYLLTPRKFSLVDVGDIMKRYDKKPVSYIISKVAATWEETVKESATTVSSLGSDLGSIAKLIIIGLGLLVISFLLLGVEFYLTAHSANPTALMILLPF